MNQPGFQVACSKPTTSRKPVEQSLNGALLRGIYIYNYIYLYWIYYLVFLIYRFDMIARADVGVCVCVCVAYS